MRFALRSRKAGEGISFNRVLPSGWERMLVLAFRLRLQLGLQLGLRLVAPLRLRSPCRFRLP